MLRQFSTHVPTSNIGQGTPVAHPLLVYAELVFQGGERELETAQLVRDREIAALID